MKKIAQSIKSGVLLLMLMIGLPAAADANKSGNKLVFLPVGYVINSVKKPVAVADWNVTDIQQMAAATGFVILPTMNGYSRQYVSYENGNYGEYIGRVITTLKAIKQVKPQADVWISVPPSIYVGHKGHLCTEGALSCYFPSSEVIETYMQTLRQAVVKGLGQDFWIANISGLYILNEELTVNQDALSSKYVQAVRKALDKVYNGDFPQGYKGLIWAPYWALENGPSKSKVISRWLNMPHHHTDRPLFDTIYIQSNLTLSSGWSGDKSFLWNSLADLRQWVLSQKINGVKALNQPQKFPRPSQIGITMEVTRGYDLRAPTQARQASKTRAYYQATAVAYRGLVAQGIDFAFWADVKLNFVYTPSLYRCIDDFYRGVKETGAIARCMQGKKE